MSQTPPPGYVSRGGEKLAAALDQFKLDPTGQVCADLGSHVGGFVDLLLQRGATRVHAVDTAYGTFAWKLRRDPRVILRERTNAMHVTLAEPVDLVTIDVGWTPQGKVLPNVVGMLKPSSQVVTLIKPHYEARKMFADASDESPLVRGVLADEAWDEVTQRVLEEISELGWTVSDTCPSPIRGHGGNRELFALLSLMNVGQVDDLP